MIQRISELDQYYALSSYDGIEVSPSLQEDFLSVDVATGDMGIDSNKFPALSSCILLEVSRAPNDGRGHMLQPNEAVSYYKSYRVGGDVIGMLAWTYIIEHPFDLGKKGPAESCPGGDHKRYPNEDSDIINAYAPMAFHAPITAHNKVYMHDGLSVEGDAYFKKTINGTCMKALWADLAETYRSDADYPPGTLVEFGGKEEITVAKFQANAVVTSRPGFVLNSEMESSDDSCRVLGIALTGRTPVRVVGPVKKFDRLCISDIQGVACKKDNMPLRNTIGIALESNDDPGEKLVMSTVQLNLG